MPTSTPPASTGLPNSPSLKIDKKKSSPKRTAQAHASGCAGGNPACKAPSTMSRAGFPGASAPVSMFRALGKGDSFVNRHLQIPCYLVGGLFNPFEKYARQIGNLPTNWGENKKCLKPPPSCSWAV